MAVGKPMDVIENLRTIKLAHSSAVTLGEIIVNNGTVLVAVKAMAISTDNAYIYRGKVEMPKEASLAINQHDDVYWDASAGKVTKTQIGNTPCGYCVEKAAGSDSIVVIYLKPAFAQSHTVIASGVFTTAGGDVNETIAITGALATDLAIVTLETVGSTPRTITTAKAASGQIDVVMSGDPSTDHKIAYMLLRAA